MNIIFNINGGLGKVILSTAVVKALKKKYKNSNIIISSGSPDVFNNNPDVYKSFHLNEVNVFYSKFIKDKKCKYFTLDPYDTSDFITQQPVHLIKMWCNLLDIKYNNEQPEIFLSKAEIDSCRNYYNFNQPIFVIHPNGGPATQPHPYSWTRDLPECVVNLILKHMGQTHKCLHIKSPNQITYEGCIPIESPWRSVAVLLQMSDKRLLIDSFSQHLAKALNLKSTVCWITTKPEIFGYDLHDNILANEFTNPLNYDSCNVMPISLSQDVHSCAYNNLEEIFDTYKIIDSLQKNYFVGLSNSIH